MLVDRLTLVPSRRGTVVVIAVCIDNTDLARSSSLNVGFGDYAVDTICATCNHFFVLGYPDAVHAAVVGGLWNRSRLHHVRNGVTFNDLLASALPLDSHRDLNLRAERTTFLADICGVDGLKVVFDDCAQVRGLQITLLLR